MASAMPEARDERQQRDALRIAAAQHEPGHHPDERDQHRQHEQQSAGRRGHGIGPAEGRASTRRRHRARARVRRRIGGERDRTRCVVQAQQQRDGERGGRERDDDAGDQQRLRHRVAAEARARAAPRDGAQQQEDAAAHDVERQDLAQRLRVDDQPVNAQPTRRPRTARSRASSFGRAHRSALRCGAPASISARTSASVGISANSMTTISGFANPAG